MAPGVHLEAPGGQPAVQQDRPVAAWEQEAVPAADKAVAQAGPAAPGIPKAFCVNPWKDTIAKSLVSAMLWLHPGKEHLAVAAAWVVRQAKAAEPAGQW